jgi:putative membrane protein
MSYLSLLKTKDRHKIANVHLSAVMWYKIKARLTLFLKGMTMGAADVVPGVSGGTMAFITNIYEQLVTALNNIDLQALRLVFKGQFKAFYQRVNGSFLLTLLLGVLTAVFTLAKLVLFLLNTHPILVWAFFMGLITASAWVVSQQVQKWNPSVFVAILSGTVVAYLVTESGIIETPDKGVYIFIAGLISIMAMILPGISGSFLLVVMNKYKLIISAMSSVAEGLKNGIANLFRGQWGQIAPAFSQVEWLTLVFFYTGTLTGLLTFAKLLKWLFERYHDLTVATLTGFLLGSLNKVWPWKQTLSYYTDRHGERKPLDQENTLPQSFDVDVFLALGLSLAGFILVLLIERSSAKVKNPT